MYKNIFRKLKCNQKYMSEQLDITESNKNERTENLYNLVEQQLASVQKKMSNEFYPEFMTLLGQPKREIIVNFPVKMDDGSLKLFKGYRVQHNNILGPYKGGLRFNSGVYLDECKALASWMTLKCSLQNLPFGGGKGGVKFNPRDHSESELEKISKGFCRALFHHIGPNKDIPAPDMGTNSQIMDWMTHMYQGLTQSHDSGAFTGKSIACGGSEGREPATGRGVVFCIEEWARRNKVELKGKSFVIQGFGNVGSFTAVLLSHLGMSCVGVGDHSGYFHSEEGFNVYKLQKYVQKNRSLDGYNFGQKISKEDFFALECDILIPAALELQICGRKMASTIKAKLIVEAANGPIDIEADEYLSKNGVTVIPDILANSGGVVVSYFEWLQNRRFEYWPESKVNQRLEERMITLLKDVETISCNKNCSLREAAYYKAIKNLQDVYLKKRTIGNIAASYDL